MNDPAFFYFTIFKKAAVTTLLPPDGKSNTWKNIILPVKGHLSKWSTISTAFSYFYTTEGGLKQAGDKFTVRWECVTLWKTKHQAHGEHYYS